MKSNRLLRIFTLVLLMATGVAECRAQAGMAGLSTEERRIFDLLQDLMYGTPKGEQVTLKDTEEVFICFVNNIYEYGTDNRLGEAFFIEYTNPNNQNDYFRYKVAGKRPDITLFPIKEVYMIPVNVFHKQLLDFTNNSTLEARGDSRPAKIKTDNYYFYKYEKYPEIFYESVGGSFVSSADNARYFNFRDSGWITFRDGDDRCGMTRFIPMSKEDAMLIYNYLNTHKPN